jgi:hypothetical protein
MKTNISLGLALLLGSAGFVWGALGDANQTVPQPTPYAVVGKDANSSVWENTVYELDPSGQIVPKIHSFTELATGLHYQQNGQWLDSKEEIDIQPNGTASATQGQHQAYFPGDIYQGQIELVTPDGLQLYSRPMGLSYFDGTNMVLIAVLTNSIGQVLGANQVIYTNAFTDFAADLVYTYTKAGFEQDIVLREQPPTPESLGLNPDTARLQVLTEFFSPPQPAIQSTVMPPQAGLSLTDQSLGFGAMQMIQGRAFLLGESAAEVGASVSKQWAIIEGRQFLVEEVPVDAIVAGLATLPLPAVQSNPGTPAPTISKHLTLPPQRLAKNSTKPMVLAKAPIPTHGFVLDYQTVNSSQTNFTFQGDTTYYISGSLTLFGTNTFEGGTVLKYATNAQLTATESSIPMWINWNSSQYRPAVFTAKDDNSVGETISGSTGNPTNYYATTALLLVGPNGTINMQYFRISYARQAVFTEGLNYLDINNGQLVNCQNGFSSGAGGTFYVRNLLFAGVSTNFNNLFACNFDVQNSTFVSSSYLTTIQNNYYQSDGLIFTNCVFVNVANLTNNIVVIGSYRVSGSYNGFYNTPNFGSATTTNTFYPFQTVGAGSYYLTNGCAFTNTGTSSIDATLLASLGQKTTFPPIMYSNVTFITNLTLAPQAPRDTNSSPSLGFHYDPLDYVFSACNLSTNLTVSAGTGVGLYDHSGADYGSYGISLRTGANLTLTGTATAPCWVADHMSVQEGGNGIWVNTFGEAEIMINGNGASPLPQLNATFTKWPVLAAGDCPFQDDRAQGGGSFANCEFYNGAIAAYDLYSLTFTNCLFYRPAFFGFAYGSARALNVTFQNCTYYDGFIALTRYAGQATTMWTIKNTAFDGTGFSFTDNLSSNYTAFDYNAYNTNNLSGLAYPYPYTPVATNVMEYVGAHDVFGGSYNWQSSWFGNFYLPSGSPLIDMGSTNANLLGLYHFTTQTNQTVEANSIVDIGYHYVATDTNGIPLDTNGDGIPDYLEDANGDGIFDAGDLGDWKISPFGLGGQSRLQVFTPLK